MRKLTRGALAAVLAAGALAACSTSQTTAEQCQPINQYDTRCEIMASLSAAPKAPTPITLERPARIRYEIHPGPSGGRVTLLSWLSGPNPHTDLERPGSSAVDLPFSAEADAPAGTNLWIRWGRPDDATCRMFIDGTEVTTQKLTRRPSGMHECSAFGSQP